jgi:hypothetical protein
MVNMYGLKIDYCSLCQGTDPTVSEESERNHKKFLSEHLVFPSMHIHNASVRLPPYTEMSYTLPELRNFRLTQCLKK